MVERRDAYMLEKESSGGKAVVVVDMQKDNVGRFCQEIIPNIKLLLERAREKGIPVVFACDSRYPSDFIFARIGHKLSCIRGTEGVKVIEELGPQATDVVIEKRMMSGFFGSDLDFTLRQLGVQSLIVVGVATVGCVLKTAMDALELGYEVMVPADCCATPSSEYHELALKIFGLFNMLKPAVAEVIDGL
jgi:nicotinamidase-related amidase